MDQIRVGLTGSATSRVSDNNTARAFGSGRVDVYATPAMVALMEQAAVTAVDGLLSEANTTVGISVSIKHLAATPIGMTVEAKAVLQEIDGRRLVFKVEAYDDKQKIGEGTHQRFIVNAGKFLNKAKEK